jgi:hypothetical protein
MHRGPEGCRRQAAKHFRELNPTALRRPDQYSECPDYVKVQFLRLQNAFSIVDQERSLLLNRECNGLTFSGIQSGQAGRRERPKTDDIQPSRGIPHP